MHFIIESFTQRYRVRVIDCVVLPDKNSFNNASRRKLTVTFLSLPPLPNLSLHRYNGSLPNGDRGRRKSRFALYKRTKANGVKPSAVHILDTPQASKVQNRWEDKRLTYWTESHWEKANVHWFCQSFIQDLNSVAEMCFVWFIFTSNSWNPRKSNILEGRYFLSCLSVPQLMCSTPFIFLVLQL